ncbi:hypothetical protein [Sphingobium fuliginis]|uniref:hypothetical protein n=1 Tax=Sphingobium fuliginis (strain ATCC 27551) TaxID=336203 RepID=UPI0003F5A58E|nr:hypothetical protein [Sphingobium fuliginis]
MSGAPAMSRWRGPLRLIVKRIGLAFLTLFLVSLVIFTISGLLPGDAAQEVLGQSATPEQVAALRHEMGLDQPGPVRYARWLQGILVAIRASPLSPTSRSPISSRNACPTR